MPVRPSPARRVRVLVATLLAAATVAGCGSAPSDAPTSIAAETEGATAYPVTLENCGEQVVVEAPPQRAVALNQGSAEVLLSLGLADRLVGSATWTDPVRPNLAADNERVPRLADDAPSFEAVLDTEPDFVSASFANGFDHGAVGGGRERYEALGVPTYLAPSDCFNGSDDAGRTQPFTMENIYREVRELAAVFDVPSRGEAFVAELQGRVAASTEAVREAGAAPVDAAYWFADTSTPYVAGCCGSPGVISGALGVDNAFADTTAEWPQVSWETVAARDPQVIVLGDLSRRRISGDALESKIEFLESNPVTSQLTAVRERRYVVMNGADMNPSIRTVDGIEKLADGLRELGVR